MSEPTSLMTSAEVQTALGISVSTMFRWIRQGKLVGIHPIDGAPTLRFDRAAIEDAVLELKKTAKKTAKKVSK
jgi:predicted site-specific integrase-resolvase